MRFAGTSPVSGIGLRSILFAEKAREYFYYIVALFQALFELTYTKYTYVFVKMQTGF